MIRYATQHYNSIIANTIWTLVSENCSFKIHLIENTKERIN